MRSLADPWFGSLQLPEGSAARVVEHRIGMLAGSDDIDTRDRLAVFGRTPQRQIANLLGRRQHRQRLLLVAFQIALDRRPCAGLKIPMRGNVRRISGLRRASGKNGEKYFRKNIAEKNAGPFEGRA